MFLQVGRALKIINVSCLAGCSASFEGNRYFYPSSNWLRWPCFSLLDVVFISSLVE